MGEMVGGIEVKSRPTANLPDRSLSRSCPVLSTFIPVQVFDISKSTSRPPLLSKYGADYYIQDPEIEKLVHQHRQAFDPAVADQATRRRSPTVENFDNSLSREQQLRKTRAYGCDAALQRAKANLIQGTLSVELLSDVGDSPSLRRRVPSTNFEIMPSRDGLKRTGVVSPSRRRDPGSAARFGRDVRPGDTRCDAQCLSPMAGGISELRSSRAWDALDTAAA